MNEPKRRGRPRKDEYENAFQQSDFDNADAVEESQPLPVVEIDDVGGEKSEDKGEFLENVVHDNSAGEQSSVKMGEETEISETEPELHDPEIPDGWYDIFTAPRNGIPIRVADKIMTNVVTVLWKRTRAFANPTHKWQETGFWVGELSGQKIGFEPAFWQYLERRR